MIGILHVVNMPVVPALTSLRHTDTEFKISPGYIIDPASAPSCLKRKDKDVTCMKVIAMHHIF